MINNFALLERLTDARSESDAAVCQWRFVSLQVHHVFGLFSAWAVVAAYHTASCHNAELVVLQALDSVTSTAARQGAGLFNGAAALSDKLRAAAPLVADAVRAGPYGGRQSTATVREPATRA